MKDMSLGVDSLFSYMVLQVSSGAKESMSLSCLSAAQPLILDRQ